MRNLRWLFGIAVLLEIYANYLTISWLILLLKPVAVILLFVYYYKKRRTELNSKDTLMLASLFFTMCGEFAYFFYQTNVGLLLIMIFYIIEHQCYMAVFREEGAVLTDLNQRRNIFRILPFILISFLFFGFFLMPKVPDVVFPFVLFYSFQTAILGSFAVNRPVNRESYRIILAAILLNVVSDCFSSIYLFRIINPFLANYFLIMSTFMASKFLFVKGILRSKMEVEKV